MTPSNTLKFVQFPRFKLLVAFCSSAIVLALLAWSLSNYHPVPIFYGPRAIFSMIMLSMILAFLGRLFLLRMLKAEMVETASIRERLRTAVREVGEGATLAHSLARSQCMPALMLHMIASGERAGELDSMLERAAELQARQLAGRITLLVSLCEPLMLLLMGGIVLFIVLAILLPILNLNQLVN